MIIVKTSRSQFDGFVPVDNVTRQSERLKADDVYVAALRADVQPLALERKMAVTDSANTSAISRSGHASLLSTDSVDKIRGLRHSAVQLTSGTLP